MKSTNWPANKIYRWAFWFLLIFIFFGYYARQPLSIPWKLVSSASRTRIRAGDYEGALKRVNLLIWMCPDCTDVWVRGGAYRERSMIHANLGQIDTAIADLTICIGGASYAEPWNEAIRFTYLARGRLYESDGQYISAANDYTKYLALSREAEGRTKSNEFIHNLCFMLDRIRIIDEEFGLKIPIRHSDPNVHDFIGKGRDPDEDKTVAFAAYEWLIHVYSEADAEGCSFHEAEGFLRQNKQQLD